MGADALKQCVQLTTQLAATVQQQLERTQNEAAQREQRMFNDIAEREHRLLIDAADREQRLLSAAAERDRRAGELEVQREQILVRDAQSARQEFFAEIKLQRDRETQREIDMRRDMYDLAAQRSRAAALEAELNCLKANVGPSTVAYEVIDVPVQSVDVPPPDVDAAVRLSPPRPVTPTVVQRSDITDAFASCSDAADARTEYSYHGDEMLMLRPPFLSSEVDASAAQCIQPPSLSTEVTDLSAQCAPPSGSVRTRRRLPQVPVAAAFDRGYIQHESDTLPRRLPHTFPRSPPETVMTSAAVPRPLAAPVDHVMTSMLPCQPPHVPTRAPTLVDPPSRDDVHEMTSTLPTHPPARHDVMISALPRRPAAIMSDPVLPPYQPHMPLHTFTRLPPDSTGAVTSMLPYQPLCVPPRPPPVDELTTSMVPRPPAMSADEMISALPRPPALPTDQVLTSALTRLPTVPGSVPMQQLPDRVASSNVCTHTVDRLLAQLPPPSTQPTLPLLSEHMQTTANQYVNRDSVPAHRYATLKFIDYNVAMTFILIIIIIIIIHRSIAIIKIFRLVCHCLLCRHLRTCRPTLVRRRRTLMTGSVYPLLLNKLIVLIFHV